MSRGRDLTWDELRARGLAAAPDGIELRGHRVRGHADDRLHVRHHRPAEGRGARARRLPREDGLGGLLPGRPAPGRDALLGHGHGLDHGPVGDGRRGLHRRDRGDVRGRAGLARAGPRVGLGRAARRERAGRVADADQGAEDAGRRASGGARPLEPARLRLDRRAVEPGALPLAVGRGGRRAGCRSSTSPAAPRWERASSLPIRSRRSRSARSAARRTAWTSTCSTRTGTPCGARSGSWSASGRGRA